MKSAFLFGIFLFVGFLSPAQSQPFPPGFRWCVNSSQLSAAALAEDVALVNWLKAGTSSFSLDWSKIEPRPGEFDLKVLKDYRDRIKILRVNGIQPMVTLQEKSLPPWVRKKGGWGWKGLPRSFHRYIKIVWASFGDLVYDWVTITIPPQGISKTTHVFGLLKVQATAYGALHEFAQKGLPIRVGLSFSMTPQRAKSFSIFSALETGIFKKQVFSKKGELQDFLVIQNPKKIKETLEEIHRRIPRLSLLIAKKGVSQTDPVQEIGQISKVLGNGIPLEGFCQSDRALFFEAKNESQGRNPRDSAFLFQKLAKESSPL